MKKQRWFWGILFLVAAILLVGSQLHWFVYPFNFWNLVLTIILVIVFLKSLQALSITGITFSLAFLLLLYQHVLGLSLSFWTILFAALLIDIGLSLIIGPFLHRRHFRKVLQIFDGQSERIIKDQTEDEDTDDGEKINLSGRFNSTVKYIHSQNLKTVKIAAHFCDLSVYFEQVEANNGKIEVYFDSAASNIELYIPQGWQVINELSPLLSNVESEPAADATIITKRIRLSGEMRASNLEIHYLD
jgi:predicted membrane protein